MFSSLQHNNSQKNQTWKSLDASLDYKLKILKKNNDFPFSGNERGEHEEVKIYKELIPSMEARPVVIVRHWINP